MKSNTNVKFSTSKKVTDTCLVRAKYITEMIGEDLTKKNINKNYKRCLRDYREEFSKNTEQEVGMLHCVETKAEIGCYLKTSYQEWDSLSILYVNPAFRGQGHSQTLISLYDMYCKEASVIELSANIFEEQKSLYEFAGYTIPVSDLFPTSVGLIKKTAIDAVSRAVQEDCISHDEIYEMLHQITKDCFSKSDIGLQMPKIRKVFRLFKTREQVANFCHEYLMHSHNERYLLNELLRDYLEVYTTGSAA